MKSAVGARVSPFLPELPAQRRQRGQRGVRVNWQVTLVHSLESSRNWRANCYFVFVKRAREEEQQMLACTNLIISRYLLTAPHSGCESFVLSYCDTEQAVWWLSLLTLPMLKLLSSNTQRFLKTIETLSCWYSLDNSLACTNNGGFFKCWKSFFPT